ncbi:ABC transporter substrate-binding protein [Allobranchiibius huperziae]|uniref:Spermidine/putrescine transport system substrate-binding protein n=1 Tax=Allobranchiibius huperziae TaxID=1874116 RepID=A0A853DPQ5_9MICO|nr:spermidine/putrescine ABC transporter substrate-binding protein [Allobranchiibius huperziae]NYJ76560.1 spermidine/putrescine transport system substrate-binding protein [Allobranchiibius huperziae]
MRTSPAIKAATLTASAVLALAITGCGSSSSKTSSAGAAATGGSKSLHIYAWAGEIPDAIVKSFEKSTGISVTVDTFDSNETMTTKLSAGGAGYDLVEPSQYTVQQLSGQKLIRPLDHSAIKGLSNLSPKFLNPSFDPNNKYSVPLVWGTTGMAYNDKCTGGAKLTSWSALFDPKFKGKIYMLDNELSAYIPALQINGYHATSTSKDEIAKATETLRKQKPLLAGYNSTNYATLLSSGQACVAEAYNGSAIAAVTKANPHVHFVQPSEGGTVFTDGLAIPSGAKNLTSAYAFINYTLQPKIAAMETNVGGNATTNEAAKAYITDKSLLTNPAVFASNASVAKADFILNPGKALAYFNAGWTKVRAS